MDKKKASLIFGVFFFAIVSTVPAFGESVGETTSGRFNDQKLLSINEHGSETYLWTSTPEKINDGQTWKKYILTETANEIFLESASSGSLVFNKNSCSYNVFNAGKIQNQATKIKNISWTVKGKSNSSSTWANVYNVNNAACIATVNATSDAVTILATKTGTSGIFQIKLDYVFGGQFKETMRGYNNNPAWNNHNIGFTETFEVPRVIKLGNQTYDLADYNGTTLNRNWIENNNAKLIKLTDNIFYDFGIGFEQLDDIKIYWDGSTAKLSLNYLFGGQIVPYQTWFEVDPTFGYSTGNFYRAVSSASSDTSCNSGSSTDTGTPTNVMDPSTGIGNCAFNSAEWDISSLPVTLNVQNTNLRIDTGSLLGVARNCDVKPMANRPSTASAATLWTDINDGTAYISNNAFCASAANDWVLDLGTSADTDIKNARAGSVSWFGVGLPYNPNTRNADAHRVTFAQPELEITYTTTTPPNAPRDLTVTVTGKTTVDLDWTQPNLNGNTLIGYQANRTSSGLGNPQTVITNSTTSLSVTASGLTACTNYSFRIGIQGSQGYNGSGNIANATTACLDTPAAPTLSAIALSDIALRFTSINGTTGDREMFYYGFRCSLDGGPWVTVVSNSTTPSPRIYEYGGLSLSSVLICQWRDGSAAGFGPWSNNATATPVLDVVQTQRSDTNDPVMKLKKWIEDKGGLYFGMGLFPFIILLIGAMATPRTTHIFTLIVLLAMGIIHAAGFFVYPAWYWSLAILFGIVLVFAKR